MPGYGASSPAGQDVENYADRIAAMLAALRLPQQTDILGNGFGGFIAVALATRHGAKFDRLIVADALATFPEPAKQPLRNLAANVAQEGMAGALDQTTPPALARELAEGIAGARFLEIPGCGHCPQIEDPRAFVDAVNGFLPRARR